MSAYALLFPATLEPPGEAADGAGDGEVGKMVGIKLVRV